MNTTEFATLNRHNLVAKLEPGSMAVVNSNDIMPTNSDGEMPYRANNDMYWLTGISQEDCCLMLFPDHPDANLREVLFVKHVDQGFVKWHGKRLSIDEACNISGIRNVKWETEFINIFSSSANYARHMYLNTIEHPRSSNMVQTRDHRFIAWCKKRFPLHNYQRLAPVLGELRKTKSGFEIAQLQKACDITEKGFRRVLKFVKPGAREKHIEAEMIHEYMQHGGDWSGYEPIVASGANTCILHYITNHNICQEGELLLIDAAASHGLFNADLTRTIPVSGTYNKRQKEVYNAVLKVHKAVKSFAKAGLTLIDIQNHCNELLTEQLLNLKLMTPDELKKNGRAFYLEKYCYHDFGHLLGLDVHDVGHKYEKLTVNSVFTVEPGIYIQEENIGIRIENNVLATATGTIDLMANIPIEVEEIEDIMNG
jgi:Xaa-Pro aminopeptidase